MKSPEQVRIARKQSAEKRRMTRVFRDFTGEEIFVDVSGDLRDKYRRLLSLEEEINLRAILSTGDSGAKTEETSK